MLRIQTRQILAVLDLVVFPEVMVSSRVPTACYEHVLHYLQLSAAATDIINGVRGVLAKWLQKEAVGYIITSFYPLESTRSASYELYNITNGSKDV